MRRTAAAVTSPVTAQAGPRAAVQRPSPTLRYINIDVDSDTDAATLATPALTSHRYQGPGNPFRHGWAAKQLCHHLQEHLTS